MDFRTICQGKWTCISQRGINWGLTSSHITLEMNTPGDISGSGWASPLAGWTGIGGGIPIEPNRSPNESFWAGGGAATVSENTIHERKMYRHRETQKLLTDSDEHLPYNVYRSWFPNGQLSQSPQKMHWWEVLRLGDLSSFSKHLTFIHAKTVIFQKKSVEHLNICAFYRPDIPGILCTCIGCWLWAGWKPMTGPLKLPVRDLTLAGISSGGSLEGRGRPALACSVRCMDMQNSSHVSFPSLSMSDSVLFGQM